MSKLSITTDEGIDDLKALYVTLKVVQQGRVSVSKHGPCYAFASTFHDGTVVYAERTKAGTDTFRVAKTIG